MFCNCIINKRIGDRSDNHCSTASEHNIPAAAEGGIEAVIHFCHSGGIVFTPHTRGQRHQLENQCCEKIDRHCQDRDLGSCFRAEALADHIHTEEAYPAEYKTAVKRKILY